MTPELSRLERIDSLGEGGRTVAVEASPAECAALAERFGLRSVARLAAEAVLKREGDIVFAEGRIKASVVQTCVASGEPVPAAVDEPFCLRFVPVVETSEDEIAFEPEDFDTIDYSGNAIDLGEALAETLALSLDPFPRVGHADEVLKAAGVLSEDEIATGPFAALKALKDKLG